MGVVVMFLESGEDSKTREERLHRTSVIQEQAGLVSTDQRITFLAANQWWASGAMMQSFFFICDGRLGEEAAQ